MSSNEKSFFVKKLETKEEIEMALSLLAKISIQKLPTLSTLKGMSPEIYYDSYLKHWKHVFLKEKLSYGVFDKATTRLVAAQMNMDLFAEVPKEVAITRELDPLFDRDDAVCIKGLKEMLQEGLIQPVKNRYIYIVISGKEDFAGPGVSVMIGQALMAEGIRRGFEYLYAEGTSPTTQKIWIKSKPDYIKKIILEDFVDDKGNRPFEGVDLKKFGYPDEKPAFYIAMTRIDKAKENKISSKL